MRININQLINCYEEMIRGNPEDATIYEVGAITAELVLEGLKQQREDLKRLEQMSGQHDQLVTILDNFYWEGVGHVMYFTDAEANMIANHLIKNGVRVIKKQEENNK